MKGCLLFVPMLLLSASVFSKELQSDSLKMRFDQAKMPQERMTSCLALDNYYRNIIPYADSIRIDNEYQNGTCFVITL